jgi:hypothetical protein
MSDSGGKLTRATNNQAQIGELVFATKGILCAFQPDYSDFSSAYIADVPLQALERDRVAGSVRVAVRVSEGPTLCYQ